MMSIRSLASARRLLRTSAFASLQHTSQYGPQLLAREAVLASYMPTNVRFRSSMPMNTVVVFVPQQEAWVVERMGKFNKILEPGLNFLVPIIDSVKYVQSLKEMAIEIPQQSAVTADNVTLSIDGVLYLKVFDPYKASYNIENPEFSVTQLAQTSMRSEIGKIQLDSVFRERESLNTIIVGAINNATSPWGIACLRYEIRDIKLPQRVQEAMQLQVEAERKKRAQILESEGSRDAQINVAEGTKRSTILRSEAFKIEQINQAQGQANAILARAQAKAKAVSTVASVIKQNKSLEAATFMIAEQYVKAFSNLAKTTNTVILPSDAGDVNRMIAQAFSTYKSLSSVGSNRQDNELTSGNNSGASNDTDVEEVPDSLFDDEEKK